MHAPVVLAGLIAAILLGACTRDPRTPVYVYSPHGRDQLLLLEREFEKLHPQYDVRWLDMGSQEILDRIRFEKVNPQADVWFGGPSTIFDRAISEDLLAPYRPVWAEHVNRSGIGPRDLYFPVYRTPAIIAYNSNVVSPAEAPLDWEDVLDPRWKGKVLIRDPMASGTMRAIWGYLIARGLESGGGEEAGFDYLRRLDAQTKSYVLNPALLVEKLARQEGIVTLWDLQDILIAQDRKLPFGYSFPKSGTVVIEDVIAIVKGARHPDAARAYIDYVGSVDAQILAARHIFRLPARHDLPEERVPGWVTRVEHEMKAADINWALLARKTKGWMTTWDQEVRGRGGKRP